MMKRSEKNTLGTLQLWLDNLAHDHQSRIVFMIFKSAYQITQVYAKKQKISNVQTSGLSQQSIRECSWRLSEMNSFCSFAVFLKQRREATGSSSANTD